MVANWTVSGVGTVSGNGPTTTYTAPASGTGTATVTAEVETITASATVTVTAAGSGIDYSSGFTSASLSANGSAAISGSRLRLTSGGTWQAGSAFATDAVNLANGFTTTFRFRMTNLDGDPWSLGDGMAFVIQSGGATALGTGGSGLGYQGMTNSVAVKFDTVNNAGEGVNSTGLYTGGSAPTTGASDLTNDGLDLHSGHDFEATIAYANGTLSLTLTDTTTGKKATRSWSLDLTTALGGDSAWVGFTAGTGSLAGKMDVLSWTLTA